MTQIHAHLPLPERQPHPLRVAAALCLCALLLLLVVDRLDPAFAAVGSLGDGTLGRIALNALPALAVLGLALALTRRLLLATWLTGLLLAALYGANSAKLNTLGSPLLPADLQFLTEPASALQLFQHYLKMDTSGLVLIGAGVVLTVALCRQRAVRSLTGWRRWLLGAFAAAACASLLAGTGPWRRLYDPQRLFQPWQLTTSMASSGLVSTLLLYHWELGAGDVPAVDRAAASALLQRFSGPIRSRLGAAATPAQLPDIVVVQSESLFDPVRLHGVAAGRWLRQYHRLARNATSGELRVPTFGGGTIRTEFEVLTGAPLSSLGGIQYPWMELSRARLPSLARTLDAHGYRSVALHPNSAAFWNRAHAYPALGFDRFIDGSEFAEDAIVGLFTGDAALTDRILAELDGGADQPQFLFAISMENHGPFDWRPNLDAKRLAALPMPQALDEGARLWFGNYLYLLDDADHELGRLADALKKRERRTVLLFYGDHLPLLEPVYAQLGFDDGRAAKEQPVPWLLLDTGQKPAKPRQLDTQSWLLPTLLLETAGIGDHAYFTVLDTLRGELDLDGGEPDADTRAGLTALARAHLRGDFDALLKDAIASAAAD